MVESKYLVFKRVDIFGRKTPVFEVDTKAGECLGLIRFHPAWHKFAFFPARNTLFDATCLSDIMMQLNDATAEWNAGVKK